MSYVVFARKWRPQSFDEVICQQHITTTLKNAIAGDRVAHAYIFTGPRGIGKTSVARIFAKGLNCEQGPTDSPCNKCASCNSVNSGTSMDVIEIDGASNNSVDQVRELRENIKFSPAYGRYKVYIIDEVHMLSLGAFNALLKTLEEPPAHAKFIFATTNPERVPPTVLSRCQRFDFGRIPLKLIISKLTKIIKSEKLDISEDAVFSIAKASDGSMRDAESILDQLASFCGKKIDRDDVVGLLGIIEEDRLSKIAGMLSQKDAAGLLKEIDALIRAGKDMSQFLTGLMAYLRNLMVLKVSKGASSLIDLPENHIAALKEEMNNFRIEELLYIFYVLQATSIAIRRSEVARFIIEASFIKLSLRDEMMSLSEIAERISRLESGVGKSGFYPDEKGSESAPLRQNSGSVEKARPVSDERRNHIPPASAVSPDVDTAVADRVSTDIAAETKKTGPESDGYAENAVTLTKEAVKKAWPQIIQVIKGKKISIASYLLEGNIIDVGSAPHTSAGGTKITKAAKNPTIVLGFPRKFNFHKEVLEHDNNRKFIENIASDVLGCRVQLGFVTLEDSEMPRDIENDVSKSDIPEEELEQEAKKDVFDEPIIQSAMEIFNGRIIRDARGRADK